RMTDSAALEEPRAVSDAHLRAHRDHRFRHDLVDVHALRRPVLRDHLFRDVGEEHHPVLVTLVALLDDQTRSPDALHDAHRLHHIDVAVHERDVRAHHVAYRDVVPHVSPPAPTRSFVCLFTPHHRSLRRFGRMPVRELFAHVLTILYGSNPRRLILFAAPPAGPVLEQHRDLGVPEHRDRWDQAGHRDHAEAV